MPKIRSVSIKNFRSIRSLEFDATDLTTIVGDNDSGKSNILRALNLFFNGETDPGRDFEFDNDFNKFVVLNKQAPQIDVELVLELPEGYRDVNGDFVRWKKSWRKNGLQSAREWVGLRSLGVRRGKERFSEVPIEPKSKLPALLSRVEFEYVPAIRGQDYVRRLRGRIYQVIADVAEQGFRASSGDFEQAIGEHVEPLMASLLDDMNEQASLKLPNDLSEIFEQLDFLSGEKLISLESRGDGIKGRYVPHILKFMAEKKQSLLSRGTQPYTFIWAYEEPENNLEFRRAQQLATFFHELASDQLTQILVTTHSPIFFNLKNEHADICSTAFISRSDDENGTIARADLSTLDELDERMGVMSIVSPYVHEATERLQELEASSVQLQEQIDAHNQQLLPSIFVEGPTDHQVVERILQVCFPEAQEQVCMLPPPARAGAGYVGNMLLSWEFKKRTAPPDDRSRACGILDDDEAGRREREKVGDLRAKYVQAKLLKPPAALAETMDAGFKTPIVLEHQYPIEWWQHASNSGWLLPRNPTDYLNDENLNRLVNQEIELDELLADLPWSIAITNAVNDDHKVEWANWICAKEEEEFRDGLQNLVEVVREALISLNVLED